MTERNPILQSLFDRKSVRVYEEKPIPAEMKQAILEAAAQAPSAGCQQLYTILDITDPALKEALAESCDHQPFIAKAPLVLVFCADCKKWYDAYLEVGCTPRTCTPVCWTGTATSTWRTTPPAIRDEPDVPI